MLQYIKFINLTHLNLYLHNYTGESTRNFYKEVYFRPSVWLKGVAHIQNNLLYISLFKILLAGRLIRSYMA